MAFLAQDDLIRETQAHEHSHLTSGAASWSRFVTTLHIVITIREACDGAERSVL
ncbi:hypothetical protein GT354_37110 [Streptomyces sp. SID3343]|nr:hypothetical protein [Streptomyces sp. SID3343]